MAVSKKSSPPADSAERASDLLRELILDGSSRGCEKVLDSFPELQADPDNVLELIYLEYVLRRDHESDLGIEDLVKEYIQRFPEHADEIVKLLQVDMAFNSLNPASKHWPEELEDEADESGYTDGASGPTLGTIGDYRLVEVLGQGGMGIVYRGVQKRLGRAVAIKTIQVTADLDSATILRFRKEAELASSLQHPNIAQIYEVGSHNEIPFYSMEYISAGSLAQFLRDRPLKPELAANLVAILARAVDYAHGQGVLHRDLKPANILLSPSTRLEAIEIPDSRKASDSKAHKQSIESNERYEPKIVDFGLAIQLSSISKTNPDAAKLKSRAVGTPSYMAPEQVDPTMGLAGPPTDVYALGSILYHALVGRPPFYAATTKETLRQVCQDDPTPPSNLQPKIASDLETICLKCLRKVPSARYASALELAEDLQRYLQGKPILARPASIPKRIFKWGVRNPSLVVLMAAMLVATLLTTWLWRHSEQSLNAELAQRERSEQISYDRNINLAYHEYKSNNVERALDLLSQCPESFRGWEWHYVKNICEECIWECQSLAPRQLVTASLSPDAQYIATGHGQWGYDAQQAVHVWKTDSRDVLWKLKGHPPSQITSLHFHPTELRLLSSAISWENDAQQPGLVIEWDMETGQQLRTIDPISAHSAMYSNDGQRIFVGDMSGGVKCFDATTGALHWHRTQQHKEMVLCLCESDDGRFLATSARDGTIGVWCTRTGALITGLDEMGDPRVIAWSPDMSKITICQFGGRIDNFRWKDNLLEHESSSAERESQVMKLAPDGLTFASSVLGESLQLRDAEQGRPIRQFYGHRGQIRAICFDQHGRRMLTAGADGTCRLWDMTRIVGYSQKTLGSKGKVEAIAYHPTSQQFALAIGLHRARSNTSGQPRIELWDSLGHKMTAQLFGHKDWLTTVRYSLDGSKLISGALDKTVRIWDVESKTELAVLEGHSDRIVMAAFWHADETVSVDATGTLMIWDHQTRQLLDSWQVAQAGQDGEAALTACSLHEETGLLVVAEREAISFWDLAKKKKLASLPCVDRVRELKFSRDGKLMGVASSSPEVSVFDVSNLLTLGNLPEPQRLRGHVRQVTSVDFNPDNTRLAAAGLDESLSVFELKLGHEVLKMNDNVGVHNRVAFSSDGRQLTNCEGRVIHTCSLDRLGNEVGKSSEESITAWHVEKYRASVSRMNQRAAVFHASILVEREPTVLHRRFWLAEALTDLGQYDKALKTLHEVTPKKPADHFTKLELLFRIYLLAKNFNQYEDCCREYEQLVKESGSISNWNSFAWFVALRPPEDISLADCRTKLAEIIKAAETELTSLQAIERRLKSIVNPQQLSDDELSVLRVKRADAAQVPSILASKKGQTQRTIAFFSNTIALMNYRLGDYQDAYMASERSLELDRQPQPLDHMIQAMALCQLHRQASAADPAPLNETLQQKVRSIGASVELLLTEVEKWKERFQHREYAVSENTLLDFRLQQLEFNLLSEELPQVLLEAGIDRAAKHPKP